MPPVATYLPGVVLVIDASGASASLALLHDGAVLRAQRVAMGRSSADALFPAVIEMLSENDGKHALTAIVCGAGPGSFTGLRIAASVAKGLAYGTGAALYAVSSLLLAAAAIEEPGEFVVHSDALRGERFVLAVAVDRELGVRAIGEVGRVSEASLHEPSSRTSRHVRHEDGPTADGGVRIDSAHLARVIGWTGDGPVSLETWEPSYGRLAEAQVKWEAAHGRPLDAAHS